MTGALFLGIDGGGTGCRARLTQADGTVLGEGLAGPAATRFGVDQSWSAIQTAARAALTEAGLPETRWSFVRVGVGVAGIGRPGARDGLMAKPHPFAAITFASDAMAACLGAHGGQDGGIVIIGTGSCGIARVAGQDVQVGGYGFPISDEGSGAWLGLRALRAALPTLDGRARATLMTDDVLRRYDHSAPQVVAWMDRATATDYATLAPLVVQHADQGDPVARRLMQEAADQIETICRTLMDRGAVRLSLLGGLASVLALWLAPDLRRKLADPLGDAMDGAAILAGRPVAQQG